jgi:broad specificity phosphatase PhoE
VAEPVHIHLVRHGRAAAAWDADADPGLDPVGRAQAQAAAETMAGLGPLDLISSPLRRARETAAAFEALWKTAARIEAAVGEIPSPTADLQARGRWLRERMAARWPDIAGERAGGTTLGAWRARLLETLAAFERPVVIATHYIAINAAVGAATGDERVVCFRPDNASCTVLRAAGGGLELVRLGREAETEVR